MDQEYNKQLIWVFPNGPRLLKCPFRLYCMEAVGPLLPHTFHSVDEIVSGPDDSLMYVIDQVAYSYQFFKMIYIDPSMFKHVTPDFRQPD